MQNLNDRLAAYMDKVRQLEEANGKLEQQIKEFYEKQRPGSTTGEGAKDYSKYYETIKQTQDKIVQASHDNAELLLQIDNSRLTADDFRMKFETEQNLRRTVEADINGLKKIMDELQTTKTDVTGQIESLNEELASLKKNHESESKGTQETTVGDVNVEMNAAPGDNLIQKLNDMRQTYEAMAEKNRKAAEEQFKKMSEGLKKEISEGAQAVSSTKSEVSEMKKSLQALEIELQSLLAQKRSLEETLAETEGGYCLKLSKLQAHIVALEEQVTQIREEIECQTINYEELLNAKIKLENEISTYQKLLDEGNSSTGAGSDGKGTSGSGSSKGTTSGRR